MPKQRQPFSFHSVTLPKHPGEKEIIIEVHRHSKTAPKPILSYIIYTHEQPRIKKIPLQKVDGDKWHYRAQINVTAADAYKKVISLSLYLSYRPLNKEVAIKRSDHIFRLPRKLRIALLGDSYAAGLGSEVYDLSDSKEEPAAFRSSASGAELLIKELKQRYRISKCNVSYSGAQLLGGNERSWKAKRKFKSSLLWEQDGSVGPGAQLQQVLDWSQGRKIDYLILTIGGNDMYEDHKGYSGLDRLIRYAVTRNITKEKRKEDFSARIEKGLETLEESFKKFDTLLQQYTNLQKTTLILSTYPDLTKDENGNYKEAYSSTFTIKREEMRLIYELMFQPLNHTIAKACSRYGWGLNNVMKGNSKILYHGLPSSRPWFHPLDRVGNGSDKDNTPGNRVSLHPTEKGHKEIYYKTLKKSFYRIHNPGH